MDPRKLVPYDIALDSIVSDTADRLSSSTSTLAIAIAGGSGSGKTYCTRELVSRFEERGIPVVVLEMDRYFLTKADLVQVGLPIDFDAPNSVRLSDLAGDIVSLKAGVAVDKTAYVYMPSDDGFPTAISEVVGQVSPLDWGVILVEGLFVHRHPVRDVADLVVYIDQPDTAKRMRSRVTRDTTIRHYSEEVAINRWHESVQPGFEKYIRPRGELIQGVDLLIDNRY